MSTSDKYLAFFKDQGKKKSPNAEAKFNLGRNGFYIMNSTSRCAILPDGTSAKYFHMGSCEGASVTVTLTFNCDFTPVQCKLIEPELRAYAECLYDKFVANL